MKMRTCTQCQRELPEKQFAKHGRWYRNWCLECHRARNRKYYGVHREKRIAQVTRWYIKNKKYRLAYVKEHYRANKATYRRHARNSIDRLRDDVFSAYGNKCACCGETERMFLTIDHINGNGNKHRREVLGSHLKSGVPTYTWLRQNDYPKGFQILCYNCNSGKHRNKGICPHKQKRSSK